MIPNGCDLRIVVNRTALPVEPPEEIHVCGAGRVASLSGEFFVDRESFDSLTAVQAAHGVDLVIDWEHQSEGGVYAAPNGRAPAAGWVKGWRWSEGEGVFARVEWTADAAEAIRKLEYRYLSPVTMTRKKDGKLVALKSIALTNVPAMIGATPLVHKDTGMDAKYDNAKWWLNLPTTATEEDIMTGLETYLKQLREMAGVAADADAAATMTALSARFAEHAATKTKHDAVTAAHAALRTAVCRAGALPDTADDAAVVAACHAMRPAAGESALKTELATLQAAHAAATARLSAIEVEGFLTRGVNSGRISAANEAAWRTEFLRDPAGTEARLHSLVPENTYPKPGRAVPAAAGPSGAAGDRASVIAHSARSFADDAGAQRVTSKAAWINDDLRLAGLPLLTAEESRQHAA